MKKRLIKGAGPSERLIIYFAGWGTGPELVDHLDVPEGFDVLCLWDYRTVDECLDIATCYRDVHIVAWSLGVIVADAHCAHISISSACAINGTLQAIDSEYGLDPNLYHKMMLHLHQDQLYKFNKLMCRSLDSHRFYCNRDLRNLEDKRAELEAIYHLAHCRQGSHINWTRAIVSDNDFIFPSRKQLLFWQCFRNIRIDSNPYGHMFFDKVNSWSELMG
ncbi:biotin synthase [Taylorella equigenitalis]|nr:biotin synthase [Taylorella equigenitalis]KOS58636.1 biotin synthase [Taylorella equigenitalis]